MTHLTLWCNGRQIGRPYVPHGDGSELRQLIRHAANNMILIMDADPGMAPCGPFKIEITRGDESEACGSITIQAGGELALPGYHEEIER